MRSNKIEKRIFAEHKRLAGTSEIDSKVRYVKLARSLPTFGVHFFLVKVSDEEEPIYLYIYLRYLQYHIL